MSGASWKSALLGAALFGFLGPAVGLSLLELRIMPHTFLGIIQLIFIVWKGWIFAFAAVAPQGFVVGAICGLLLQTIANRQRSTTVLITAAAMLGLILGCAVAVELTIRARLSAPQIVFKDNVGDLMPIASVTGMICSCALLLLLRLSGFVKPRRLAQSKDHI
jgi:hypothetical protein